MRSGDADDGERVEPLSTDWLCLYEGLIMLAEARPDEVVRDVVGDMEAFGMAVAHVRAYGRRDPRRFSRAGINRRLRAFAEGDERWSGAEIRDQDAHHGNGTIFLTPAARYHTSRLTEHAEVVAHIELTISIRGSSTRSSVR